MSEGVLCASTDNLTRQELTLVPTPSATATHRPIPHGELVQALGETLGFRQIAETREEYGCRFALGLRNSHDKTLSFTVGTESSSATTLLFMATFNRLSPSTRRISAFTMPYRLGWIRCKETLGRWLKPWTGGGVAAHGCPGQISDLPRFRRRGV